MTRFKFPLVLSALLLATLACNALDQIAQPTPTEVVIVEPTSPPTQSDIPSSEAEVPRVSLEKARVASDSGTAIIVDVRSKEAYDAGHIPGAVNIPLEEFEINPTSLNLPKDAWIITYCT